MAMAYCNTADILTQAMSKWADDSTELRALALGWLNETIRTILNQPRTWWFLKTGSALTVTANAITLPDGCGELINLEGTDFLFTPDDQLTDEEVFALDDDTTSPTVGYVQSGLTVTFYPSATGTVTARYEANLTADYTDSTSNTIFPLQFRNALIAGVREHYYDYDKDGRYQKENANFQYELDLIKAWDNNLKPKERKNPHGYTRVS